MYRNALLGDGSIFVNKKSIRLSFYSTSKQILDFKERFLIENGLKYSKEGTQKSGYGGEKIIYNAFTKGIEELMEYHSEGLKETIKMLTEFDLFLWYLDDGSWHITRNTMHLYSNELNEEETRLLISRIGELYGVEPRIRIDRKTDGRSYYYLYFPRELVRVVRKKWLSMCVKYGLTDFYYKFGGINYTEPERTFLTDGEVTSIREMHKQGMPYKDIASETGYSFDRVWGVANWKTYKQID